MNTNRYIFDQAWQREKERLDALAVVCDPLTIGHLMTLGVCTGWRCAEIGAGTGSIARWLAEQVGDAGRVVATDIEPRFLGDLDQSPNVEVRRHDIVAESLEADRYDLIHARYLLMHLTEREHAIERMMSALRPGGWLLLEDGDFCNYQVSYPPVDALAATSTAIVHMLEQAGADPQYGLKLLPALAHRGLINLGIEAVQVVMPCGSDKISAFTLLLAHLQKALIASGLTTAGEVEAAIKFLQTPSSTAVYGPIQVSAWGQRPGGW